MHLLTAQQHTLSVIITNVKFYPAMRTHKNTGKDATKEGLQFPGTSLRLTHDSRFSRADLGAKEEWQE